MSNTKFLLLTIAVMTALSWATHSQWGAIAGFLIMMGVAATKTKT